MRITHGLILALLLAGCGGGGRQEVGNPYLERAHDFSSDGMAYMQRERWQAAERAFGRALRAAQLADDAALVRLAWYNLGVVRAAMDKWQEAEEAYARSMQLAARHEDEVMRARAALALAMLRLRHQQPPGKVEIPSSVALPADVLLQRARLAQLTGDVTGAESFYRGVAAASRRDHAGLRMKADAYMGLALIHRDAGDRERARDEVARALSICRQIGAPRLAAHALLLSGSLVEDIVRQRDYLERALTIYTALGDIAGQRESLQHLEAVAARQQDKQGLRKFRMRLQAMPSSALTVPGR